MCMRIILGLLLLLGAAMPAVSIDIKIQEWKFDKDAPGSIPVGFVPGKLNSEAGRWQVANDPKVPSRKVLVWQGTDQAAKLANRPAQSVWLNSTTRAPRSCSLRRSARSPLSSSRR